MPVAGSIGDMLANVGLVFTSAIGMVADVADAIVATPILLLFVVLPLVGLGVGLFKRLLSVQG